MRRPATPPPAPTNAELAMMQRVQLHPATDLWMSGDRFAVVLKRLPRDRLLLQMDVSGRRIRIRSDLTTPI